MKKLAIGVSWIAVTIALALWPLAVARADDTGHKRIGTAWSCHPVKQGFECKET